MVSRRPEGHRDARGQGELDGAQKSWYPNGRVARLIEFKNGRRNGKSITWNEHGDKTSEAVYQDDSLVESSGQPRT